MRWRDFVFPTVLAVEEIVGITRSVVFKLGLRREPVEDYIQIVCVRLCVRGDFIDRADNPGALVRKLARDLLLNYERDWATHHGRNVPVVYAEDTPDTSGDPGRFVPERIDLSCFLQTAGPEVWQVLANRIRRGDERGLSSRRPTAKRTLMTESRLLGRARLEHGHLLAA